MNRAVRRGITLAQRIIPFANDIVRTTERVGDIVLRMTPILSAPALPLWRRGLFFFLKKPKLTILKINK